MVDWREYGERVLISRRRLHLSQSQVGQAIGISRPYLGLIERGKAEVGFSTIVKLRAFLGIDFPLLTEKQPKSNG